MIFEIVAEGHEGVASCEEEILDTLEAENVDQALAKYALKDSRIHYSTEWSRYLLGAVRKVFARVKEAVEICPDCKKPYEDCLCDVDEFGDPLNPNW